MTETKIVPVEPTEAMTRAGMEAYFTDNTLDQSVEGHVNRIYRAMQSASPPSSVTEKIKAMLKPEYIAFPDKEVERLQRLAREVLAAAPSSPDPLERIEQVVKGMKSRGPSIFHSEGYQLAVKDFISLIHKERAGNG